MKPHRICCFSYYSLPCYSELLEVSFSDTIQLSRNNFLDVIYANKTDPLDDPLKFELKKYDIRSHIQ